MTKKKLDELKKAIPEILELIKPAVQEILSSPPLTNPTPTGFIAPVPVVDSWIVVRDGELNYSRLKYVMLGWFFNSLETEQISIITSYGTVFQLTDDMSKDFLKQWHTDFNGAKLQ